MNQRNNETKPSSLSRQQRLVIRYEHPKGGRVLNRGLGVEVLSDEEHWSWDLDNRRWVNLCEMNEADLRELGPTTSCAPCRSLKAFKRMLRRNPQIRGKAILYSRYVGHDIFG